MKRTHFFSLLFVLLLLSACMSGRSKPPSAQLPVLSPANALQEYVIQRGDQLDIKFFYNPELNELVAVRPDGRISLQLVKEVMVAGMTPAQLNEQLTTKYAPLIRKPEISIIVRSFTAQKVFVDGEVNKPGLIGLNDSMTVIQAISQAGGFKDTANLDEVFIIRRGGDNSFVTTPVNLKRILKDGDNMQNIVLLPNDVVLVPKSNIASIDLWVDQHIRKLVPVPFGVGVGP
ncbi:polysaccharide biosynthesis/export family protein [Geotalea sp. SG265]|uniref:polysaccharide biosynthesis/export family protein n=1 Tax=Geotalea sp. SG265 TaxID=2922867 RepID=UPI001FAF8DF1|nr:polysaccharide biosynthesis/export family protein [Geotalea sp. SG265]